MTSRSIRILSAGLLSAAYAAAAPSGGTPLSGDVSGFLSADRSPYIAQNTLVVPQNKALVIGAGVTIRFLPGTGLDVQDGSLAIGGEGGAPVILTAAQKGSPWNGISVTGSRRANLQQAQIQGALNGLSVENGEADVNGVSFEDCASRGIYVKAGKVSIADAKFRHTAGTALQAASGAEVQITKSSFGENHIAVTAGQKSDVSIAFSELARNDYGILNIGGNQLRISKSTVSGNGIGFLSSEIPPQDAKSAVSGNKSDFSGNTAQLTATLPAEPTNPHAGKYASAATGEHQAGNDSAWTTLSGNLGVELGYHLVRMRRNHTGADWTSGRDTVGAGERYINYFQTPGTFANWNIYLMMQRADGKSIDFSADLSSTSWNKFEAHSVQTTYTDSRQKLSLGDVYVTGSELYLAGAGILGASYNLNLFKKANGTPLFLVSGFGGEARSPKYEGKKNPAIFKDYIDEGEAESQEMLAGGSLRWNPVPRFNATIGAIGSKDYLSDPFFRGGMSGETNTIDPMIKSKTVFADGNWLFYPGDIELNGQIAAGAADTADVLMQRAINKVFGDAGLDVSNFSRLRSLMHNPGLISALPQSELESIFGDNTLLSPAEMRKELRSLIDEAKAVQKQYAKGEGSPSDVRDWDGHNLAVTASLRRAVGHTVIAGHIRYVGDAYYSAGSPDQLSNTREIGGSIEQGLFDFWKLVLAYNLQVENAASAGADNIFGLGEGTHWGLFPDSASPWFSDHELDADRAQYIHNADIGNTFNIGKRAELSLNYSVDYRTRARPVRLYANYSVAGGVYSDPWFRAEDKSEAIAIATGSDTAYIDSARFAEYYALAGEPYLASQFIERILKQTAEADISFKLQENVLKLGGVWTYRSDLSSFGNDSLIGNLGFSDETFGKLGYYFHGADYFEQRYPVSLSTAFTAFRNRISVTPRYKAYRRAKMREYEGNVSEHLEIPLSRNFMELSIDGSARYEIFRRTENEERIREREADIDGSAGLRTHYSSALYSDLTLGAYYNYRPDNDADEYKDFYGSIALNYAF